jgi:hypothetical protein
MIDVQQLPRSEKEADDRLIKVVIQYVKNREMPKCIAIQLLQHNLRNPDAIGEALRVIQKSLLIDL